MLQIQHTSRYSCSIYAMLTFKLPKKATSVSVLLTGLAFTLNPIVLLLISFL